MVIGMYSEIERVQSPTGASLALRISLCKENPVGVVQVNHGAVEHGGRYQEFATRLNTAGFHVFVHDHRGHGKTVLGGEKEHVMGSSGNSWNDLVNDISAVHHHIDDRFEALPRIVFGHSMGALAAFEYTLRHPEKVSHLVLSAPPTLKNPLAYVGRALLQIEAFFVGADRASPVFDKLNWSQMNKRFQPARTSYDWLSSDHREVDAYISDPDCGWDLPQKFTRELVSGIIETFKDERLSALSSSTNVLLMSGDKDPVTQGSKAIRQLAARLRDAGVTSVEEKLFMNMRHEVHNDVARDAFYEKLIGWSRHCVG